MDGGDNLEGYNRQGEERSRQLNGAKRAVASTEGCGQKRACAVGPRDAQFDAVTGWRTPEIISHSQIDKGRNINELALCADRRPPSRKPWAAQAPQNQLRRSFWSASDSIASSDTGPLGEASVVLGGRPCC